MYLAGPYITIPLFMSLDFLAIKFLIPRSVLKLLVFPVINNTLNSISVLRFVWCLLSTFDVANLDNIFNICKVFGDFLQKHPDILRKFNFERTKIYQCLLGTL